MTDKNLQLSQIPIVKTGMLIRQPPSKVYEAFVDPAITTKFWFTKSTSKLELGKEITWTWEMYNVSSQVKVKEMEENKRILVEWSGYGAPTLIEWEFTLHQKDDDNHSQYTYVSITHSGFEVTKEKNADQVVNEALGSREGFAWVLAGLKAYLEQNIQLNLIGDAFP
ncbi:activator of Hsp90 ATPase 1 family protein [Cunninghamella echinulata]|nr:activator of Hsp90 ATPase 1 family protein [Cunninghamella echinulata]